MITLNALCEAVCIDVGELERWIALDLVVPEGQSGQLLFREIDVARIRLVRELRQELAIGEEALPVVMSLLDQLYRTREQMRRLIAALDETLPPAMRESVLERLF